MTYNLKQYATAIKNETRQGQNTAERIGTWMEEAANSIAEKATHTNDDGDSLVYLPKGKSSLDVYAKSQTSNGKVQYAPEDLYEKLYASSGEVELIPYNEGTGFGQSSVKYYTYVNQSEIQGKYINRVRLNAHRSGSLTIYFLKNPNTTNTCETYSKTFSVVVGENTLNIGKNLASDEYLAFCNGSNGEGDVITFDKSGQNSVAGGFSYYFNNEWGTSENQNLGIEVTTGGIGKGDINWLKSKIEELKSKTEKMLDLTGKKISIMGDSISTYRGYVDENRWISYPNLDIQLLTDTWWGGLIADTNATLEVNNSFGGSAFSTNNESDNPSISNDSRIDNLGTPDIILLFAGTNDFGFKFSPMGEYNWGEIQNRRVFKQAVTYTINRLLKQYPNARLIIMTPIHRGDMSEYPSKNITLSATGTALAYLFEYVDTIRQIAYDFGVPVIETFQCGITPYNVNSYTREGLHPNKAGMMMIKKCVISALRRII